MSGIKVDQTATASICNLLFLGICAGTKLDSKGPSISEKQLLEQSGPNSLDAGLHCNNRPEGRHRELSQPFL